MVTQKMHAVLPITASARKVRWSVNNVINVKKYLFVLALIKKAMHLLQNYDIWLAFYIYLIIILAIWCVYELIQPTGRDNIIAMTVNRAMFLECA